MSAIFPEEPASTVTSPREPPTPPNAVCLPEALAPSGGVCLEAPPRILGAADRPSTLTGPPSLSLRLSDDLRWAAQEPAPFAGVVLEIDRAPVLVLWAAVVAERNGHAWPTSLSVGRFIAGKMAALKTKALGFVDSPVSKTRTSANLEISSIKVMGWNVPVTPTKDGNIALSTCKALIMPTSVSAYLKKKFKAHLRPTLAAMRALACRYLSMPELNSQAYGLYERFRPNSSGASKRGHLNLEELANL